MNNQKEQFLEIIDSHKRLIYKVVNTYCSNKYDQQDLVQEIILQLWKSFEKYNEQYKLSTWIYRIALNTAISHYRKTIKKSAKVDSSPLNAETVKLEETIDENENLILLNRFIQELKEIDKAIMLLYLDNMSQKEIAEITGFSPSNIGTKLNRIKNQIRDKFQSQKKS